MKWFYIPETGLVIVGEVIGDEIQDILEWIAETEGNTGSGLTLDELDPYDYKIDSSTYKYYLTFGSGNYDVEITFKEDEDGYFIVDEIVACYEDETESKSFDISKGGLQFRILSDE